MEKMDIYKVILKSNCYKHGYEIKVTSKILEEAISKAKKYLEEDIDNINIEVLSITKVMENVIV